MKVFAMSICAALLLLTASAAHSQTYDAHKNYTCDQASAGVWYYESYSPEDGSYREMDFGHVPIREVSRYGVDAHYSPVGGQPLYPFITNTPEYLVGSPATIGKRYGLALTWAAQGPGGVRLTGFVRLMGNLKGTLTGKTVKAELLLNGRVLWDGLVKSGEPQEFSVDAAVAAGDRVRLRVQGAGDDTGNLTALDLSVETEQQ